MRDDDVLPILMSETGLSAPLVVESSNKGGESTFDVLPVERAETPAQFRGTVFRVMDDRLFIVDPGSPPAAPPA